VALVALSTLVACSEPAKVQQVLFDRDDVILPFGDSKVVQWRFSGEDEYERVRLERGYGAEYVLLRGRTQYAGYEFIPINSTPAEDYVVQIVTPNEDESSVSYKFVWRSMEGLREVAANCGPSALNAQGPCLNDRGFVATFRSQATLFRHYDRAIYPSLVRSSEVVE